MWLGLLHVFFVCLCGDVICKGEKHMGFVELFLIADWAFYGRVCRIHLSRDCPCSTCRDAAHAAVAGLYFGGFSGADAAAGLLCWGCRVCGYAHRPACDHWIAFVLLGAIGANMIREARSGGECEQLNDDFSFRAMLPLAVATSIDASGGRACPLPFCRRPSSKRSRLSA